MTDSRQIDGPSTPASTITFPSVVKPADGDITFTATITRDPADAGPTPVTIKDSDGNTLGSLTLTTPAGTQNISITVSNSAITQCCVIPKVSSETPIQLSCCDRQLPSTLTAQAFAYPPGCGCPDGDPVQLVYDSELERYAGFVGFGQYGFNVRVMCNNGSLIWFVASNTCPSYVWGQGENPTGYETPISCDPIYIEFGSSFEGQDYSHYNPDTPWDPYGFNCACGNGGDLYNFACGFQLIITE